MKPWAYISKALQVDFLYVVIITTFCDVPLSVLGCVLYDVIEIYLQQKQEDVVALEQVEVEHKPLPPVGALFRPKIHIGDVMYVMKLSFYGVWSRAKVVEVVGKGSEVCAVNLLSVITVHMTDFSVFLSS
jgi:hypothetical protein